MKHLTELKKYWPLAAVVGFVLIVLMMPSMTGSGEAIGMRQQSLVFLGMKSSPFYLGDTVIIDVNFFCGGAGTDWNREHWAEDCGAVTAKITLSDKNNAHSRTMTRKVYNCEWGSNCKSKFPDMKLSPRWNPGAWTLSAEYYWDGDSSTRDNDPLQYTKQRGYTVNEKALEETWDCTSWSSCNQDGEKARVCTSNRGNRRTEISGCTPPCLPTWQCTDWSVCTIEQIQERSCTDGCGNPRSETKSCIPPNRCDPGWQCKDENTVAWRQESCNWVSEQACRSDQRCQFGQCVVKEQLPPICPDITEWRVLETAPPQCISESGCDIQRDKYTYYSSRSRCLQELEPTPPMCPIGQKKIGERCCVDVNQNQVCDDAEIGCPDISGWRAAEGECVSDSGCDYDANKYTYFTSEETCKENIPRPYGTYIIVGVILAFIGFMSFKLWKGGKRG